MVQTRPVGKTVDWREAYRELAEQQEQGERARADIEILLCRAIVRVALVAEGLEPKLDPHLKRLRNAVKDGVKPSLKNQIDALSDALLRAGNGEAAPPLPAEKLLHRLLGRPQLSGQAAKSFARLRSRMLSEPDSVSDTELDSLVALISGRSSERSPADAEPGFWGRLFQVDAGADSEAGVDPNDVLRGLLERLNWPGQMSDRILVLRDRLLDGPPADAWVGAIEELMTCTAEALGEVQTEMRDAEGFLSRLTQRLHEIDTHVRGSQEDQQASLDSGRRLDQVVTEEVSGIGESVREATDLRQLQGAVEQRLDAIQEHMQLHVQDEETRFEHAERRARELEDRLQILEEESSTLHDRMVDARHQALHDPVTSLPNRLAYEERIEQEYARWKRFNDPLALAIWDIDDFKRINDRYGHQAGDKALRVIGRTFRQRLRETDFISRYGGEEFVMLLPGAEPADALRVAEQLRAAIETTGFHSGMKSVGMTISCGVSSFQEGDTPEAVFERADKALYDAKTQGKNRCISG